MHEDIAERTWYAVEQLGSRAQKNYTNERPRRECNLFFDARIIAPLSSESERDATRRDVSQRKKRGERK